MRAVRATVARQGVDGGLVLVAADGGISDVVDVSVVVVVVSVPVAGSVVVVDVLVDSVLESVPSVAQAARDSVATAKAATVRVRSVAFMDVGPLVSLVHRRPAPKDRPLVRR